MTAGRLVVERRGAREQTQALAARRLARGAREKRRVAGAGRVERTKAPSPSSAVSRGASAHVRGGLSSASPNDALGGRDVDAEEGASEIAINAATRAARVGAARRGARGAAVRIV